MRIMIVLVSAFVLWAGSAGAAVVVRNFGRNDFANYKGADAGTVLLSVNMSHGGEMLMRIRTRDAAQTGWLNPQSRAMEWFTRTDFKEAMTFSVPESLKTKGLQYRAGPDKGSILVQNLPPGRYEIYEIVVFNWNHEFHFDGLSLPFEIKTGRTSYVGAFRGLLICRKVGLYMCSSEQLAVRDQSGRDAAIAKARMALTDVDVQVTPADSLGPPEGVRGLITFPVSESEAAQMRAQAKEDEANQGR